MAPGGSKLLAWAVAFLMVVCVGAVVSWWLTDRSWRESRREQAGQQLAAEARFFDGLVRMGLLRELRTVEAQAALFAEQPSLSTGVGAQAWLTTEQRFWPQVSWAGLATSDGQVLAATQGLVVGESVATTAWFQRGRIQPHLQDLQASAPLEPSSSSKADARPQRFIELSAPLRRPDGVVLGVLGTHLSADWLRSQLAELAATSNLPAGSLLMLMGPDHTLRMSSGSDDVPWQSGDAAWSSVQLAQTGAKGWRVETGHDGKAWLVGYHASQGAGLYEALGWTVLVAQPESAVMAGTSSERWASQLALLVQSLAALLIFYLLARWLQAPVAHFVASLQRAQEPGNRLVIDSRLPREFREVAQTIDNLLVTLHERERTLAKTLEELRQSFSGVTQSFPGVLFTLELGDRGEWSVVYLSPSAAHYFEGVDAYSTHTPLAIWATQLFSPEGTRLDSLLDEAARRTDPSQMEWQMLLRTQGQNPRHFRWLAHLRQRPSGELVWDGMLVDVTDLVLAGRAAQWANRAKSQFLANVSHELRSPLNGLMGLAQILDAQLADAPEETRQDIAQLVQTAKAMGVLLNDILDHSRIELGKLSLDPRPVSLSTFVREATALTRLQAHQAAIPFEVLAPAELPSVQADATRLSQVVSNLLSNALKFANGQAIRMEVKAVAAEPEPDGTPVVGFWFSVSDRGRGMSQEQVERLFRPFEQTDAKTYGEYGGSGLGLSIVKGLVDAMGGEIQVASELGQGTTFEVMIRLPLVTAADQPLVQPAVLAQQAEAAWKGLRVLVVDDVALNRSVVVRRLRKWGSEVEEARDGEEACRLTEAHRYDIILMDVDMPVLDGIEATRRIRSVEGPSQQSLIVALTGRAFAEEIQRALEAGMDHHLSKPLDFALLARLPVRDASGARA